MRVTPGSLARLVAYGDSGAELLGQELLGTTHDDRVPRRERRVHDPAAGSRTVRPDANPLEPTGPARAIRPGEPVPLDDGGVRHERAGVPLAARGGTRHERDDRRTGSRSGPGALRAIQISGA